MEPSNRSSRAPLAVLTLVVALAGPGTADFRAAESSFLQDSMAARADWMERNLARRGSPDGPEWGLRVLANHDPVIRNRRGEEPLRIAGKAFSRGLYCHAVSKVLVKLPSPGKSFTALVGLDDNPDTRSGKGSVVFSVSAGDKTLFKSDVLRIGMPAVPVSVDLAGAREFLLEIGDAGDGISWDQSDWAEARVVLDDGRELWVGDMEIRDAQPPPLPFSFQLDGQDSSAFLSGWRLTASAREPDPQRVERTFAWTDPKTGLEVRCASVEYRDFPTVEWTLHFKNTGPSDSPVLSSIQALDAVFPRGAGLPVLHYFDGGYCGPQAYKPQEAVFSKENGGLALTPGGRGSDRYLPYFNLEIGDGGVIAAIGWPGQWRFETAEENGGRQRLKAGQELARFRLHPGEEVRSPLIALQFWKGGDWIDAQNVWRRWMIAHNMPLRDGRPLAPQLAGCSSHLFNEMLGASEENQVQFVTRHAAEGLRLDYWWMDAGWYPNDGGWWNTGTWEVDTRRFPRGLRAISDVAHQKGMKTIVWFEPERVTKGTWLWDHHPEWLIGQDPGVRLLNVGNKEAWRWLVDHVDRVITEQGIDLYRQDFNINPLAIWRASDPPDRQGITEIRYNEGYLAFWDELRRRHPGMLIDSCSSGGRRNDLETLRRAVPLLRSDDIGVPVNEQCHTYGFASWVPYWGTGAGTVPYQFRSCMGWHMTIGPDARKKDEDYAGAVRLTGQWREVADRYLGDYYPLTPYSLSEHDWMAFQFNRPEPGDGMVLAYRRSSCDGPERRFRLRGLLEDARYEVRDLDAAPDAARRFGGRELMGEGLPVALPERPSAAVLAYRRTGS
jgi:alpha-galactosidase